MTDYESVGCVFKSRRARYLTDDDGRWMSFALAEAKSAGQEGEVPIGCVVVLEDRIIGRGHNRTEALNDPTAHAEIIALSAAASTVGNWRLTGATVYCTTEPCMMCSGALVLARPDRVVYGAADPKFGCLGSRYDVAGDNLFNHRFEVAGGVCGDEAAALLRRFFRQRRESVPPDNSRRDGRVDEGA